MYFFKTSLSFKRLFLPIIHIFFYSNVIPSLHKINFMKVYITVMFIVIFNISGTVESTKKKLRQVK